MGFIHSIIIHLLMGGAPLLLNDLLKAPGHGLHKVFQVLGVFHLHSPELSDVSLPLLAKAKILFKVGFDIWS